MSVKISEISRHLRTIRRCLSFLYSSFFNAPLIPHRTGNILVYNKS